MMVSYNDLHSNFRTDCSMFHLTTMHPQNYLLHREFPKGLSWALPFILIFLNDIPKVASAQCKLYTEGYIIFNVVNSTNVQLLWNGSLNNALTWVKYWQTELNVKKCVQMIISQKNRPPSLAYSFSNAGLPTVDRYKYLEVMLTSDLCWSCHADEVTRKTTKRLRFLRCCLHVALVLISFLLFTESQLSGTCFLSQLYLHMIDTRLLQL